MDIKDLQLTEKDYIAIHDKIHKSLPFPNLPHVVKSGMKIVVELMKETEKQSSLKTAKAIRNWVHKFEGTELNPTSIRETLDSIINEIETGG